MKAENRQRFLRQIAIVLMLCQVFSSMAFAKSSLGSSALDVSEAQEIVRLKKTKIGDYFTGTFRKEIKAGAFEKDIQAFTNYAEDLGVFPPTREFRSWWAKNRASILVPEEMAKVKDESLSAFATAVFLRYSAEKANELDKADPRTAEKEKNDEPTEGSNFLSRTISQIEQSGWSPWLIYTVGGTALGAGIAITHKLSDTFFHGPVAQLMNTALEPFTRPVNERIALESNTHIAPRTIWWAKFVNGEGRRRKKALKKAAQGEELTGALARFKHPAIGVNEFVKDSELFYDNMLKADYAWRGWSAPEIARARNTGFELLYHQYRVIGEQLTGYQNAKNVNQMLQLQVNRPALLNVGAKPEEIELFSQLVQEHQDIMVFKDVNDPKLAETEEKIQKLLRTWTDKGISTTAIDAFYEVELEKIIAQNRSAFLMASVLDGERYFQENNLALKSLPEIQKWQEQAREMTGFYDELQMHAPKIQKYFDLRGLKYDVQARIDERGFPLGQDPRPVSAPPIRDCVKNYLNLIPKK